MNNRTLAVILAAVVAAAGGLYWATRHAHPLSPAAQPVTPPPAAPAPAIQTPPPAASSPPASPPAPPGPVPADCLLPGPPPVPPDGSTATAADMKTAHDVIQAFVKSLEAYQACRDNQADYPRKGLTQAQRDQWIAEGDAAVDEANALAAAFAAQIKIFQARTPKK